MSALNPTATVDMDAFEYATLLRDAADVKRWHTCRTLRQQTVGAHSFGLMLLLRQVYPEARKEVFFAAMHHDLPELVVGDMPSPTKNNSTSLSILMEEAEKGTAPLYEDFELTSMEEDVLKWCDYMELVIWCLEEVQMGNVYATQPAARALAWVRGRPNLAKVTVGGWPGLTRAASTIVNRAVDTARRLGVKV